MGYPPVNKLYSLSDKDIISQRVCRRGVLALGITVGAALSRLLGTYAAYGQESQPKTKFDNDKKDHSTRTDRDPTDRPGRGRGMQDQDPTDRAGRGSDSDPSDRAGMGKYGGRREPGGLPSAKPEQPLPKE